MHRYPWLFFAFSPISTISTANSISSISCCFLKSPFSNRFFLTSSRRENIKTYWVILHITFSSSSTDIIQSSTFLQCTSSNHAYNLPISTLSTTNWAFTRPWIAQLPRKTRHGRYCGFALNSAPYNRKELLFPVSAALLFTARIRKLRRRWWNVCDHTRWGVVTFALWISLSALLRDCSSCYYCRAVVE